MPEETRQLQSILQEAEDRGLCELVVRTNATLDLLDEVVRRHGSRVALLPLQDSSGTSVSADAD